MIQRLQSISRRERIMLTSFIVVCLLIWASSIAERWETSASALREARKSVKQQEIWLQSAPLFQAQLDANLTRLDSSQMLDGRGLTAFVDSYARKHNLKHEMTSPNTKAGEIYSQSSIRVTLRNITLEELIQLQIEVDSKRPYIAMEAIALVANRADPRLLNARLNLSAFALREATPPKS